MNSHELIAHSALNAARLPVSPPPPSKLNYCLEFDGNQLLCSKLQGYEGNPSTRFAKSDLASLAQDILALFGNLKASFEVLWLK